MAAAGSRRSSSDSLGTPTGGPLLLMGRRFTDYLSDGSFRIRDNPVYIRENHDASQGTGLNVWDGSILLAKCMESLLSPVSGMVSSIPPPWTGFDSGTTAQLRVLELGCGTGLAGIATALAGGNAFAVLSDLPYTLHLAANNAKASIPAESKSTVVTAPLDWMSPIRSMASNPHLAGVALGGGFDLVVAADVVWLKDLVLPLVRAMRSVARIPRWSADERTRFHETASALHGPEHLPAARSTSPPRLPRLIVSNPKRVRTSEASSAAVTHGGDSESEGTPSLDRAQSPSERRDTIFLVAHQTRSLAADRELFSLLDQAGFDVTSLPDDYLHEDYRDKDIQVLHIVLGKGKAAAASASRKDKRWDDETVSETVAPRAAVGETTEELATNGAAPPAAVEVGARGHVATMETDST